MAVTVVASDKWQITQCPNLWQMPAGNQFVLNWDPVNGSDRPGEADGLATGSRAFKSANNALDFAGEVMAANISAQFTVKCTYNGGSCAGQSDPLGIHWPPHGGSPIGSQGGSGIILNCNGASLTGNPSYGGFFAAAIIQPTGCNFVNGVSGILGGAFSGRWCRRQYLLCSRERRGFSSDQSFVSSCWANLRRFAPAMLGLC